MRNGERCAQSRIEHGPPRPTGSRPLGAGSHPWLPPVAATAALGSDGGRKRLGLAPPSHGLAPVATPSRRSAARAMRNGARCAQSRKEPVPGTDSSCAPTRQLCETAIAECRSAGDLSTGMTHPPIDTARCELAAERSPEGRSSRRPNRQEPDASVCLDRIAPGWPDVSGRGKLPIGRVGWRQSQERESR